jgi:hypothetical protein
MTSWMISSILSTRFMRLAIHLDHRIRPLFRAILIGIFSTSERRRTASSWFRAGEIGGDFRRAYNVIGSVGREAEDMAATVLLEVENSLVLAEDEEMTFAIDDTPSKRYGPEVEGAGLHHNPTPGPSGAEFVYGHSFVTLARVVSHPDYGTISLPVRGDLYVRQKDIAKIPPERLWKFRTKIQMAVEQLKWLAMCLKDKRRPIWVVADGAYAKRAVLKAAKNNGIILVSRLRKDAALRTLPGKQPSGKRGKKPKYGRVAISLAKRAGQKGGWQTEKMWLYGKEVTKTYKTFLATWRPAGGVIRVVLVKEEHDWRAYFCTKTDATPAEILGKVAGRTSIEETFKDVKQVWGAGQQQLRNIHANIGAWHLNLWAYTLTELWAWDKSDDELVDRSASPWDNEPRRPSHADRRKALQRERLREEYKAALEDPDQNAKLRQFCERLMQIAA